MNVDVRSITEINIIIGVTAGAGISAMVMVTVERGQDEAKNLEH